MVLNTSSSFRKNHGGIRLRVSQAGGISGLAGIGCRYR
jgi:hypothetical protein